jgi:ATP-dependent DNA helicase RecG
LYSINYYELPDNQKDCSAPPRNFLIISLLALLFLICDVLIGVSDSGEFIGSTRAVQGLPIRLQGMISERTTPSINTYAHFITENDKTLVVINVPQSQTVTSTNKGLYLKRRLNSKGVPENFPMSPDEIMRATTRLGLNDLSATSLLGATIDDIDLDLVISISKEILKNNPSEAAAEVFSKDPIYILNSLGLLDRTSNPIIATLLLFGKKESIIEKIPNHFVQYQVFGVSGEILKNEKYYDPIVKLFPKLINLPEISKNTDEVIINGRSIVIPEYAHNALREAFANALVHRDYTMHSGIQIQVFTNELKVSSAGGFLEGITIDNLLNAPPTPRNRRLAEAMMRLKFVETSGRGIDVIYYSQARFGRPAPDYSETTPMYVVVRLAGGQANLDFCKLIHSLGEPTLLEMLVLNGLFLQRSMNTAQVAKLLQCPENRAKELLNQLLKKEWIEIIDEKNPIYFLRGTTKIEKNRLTQNNFERYKSKVVTLLNQHPGLNRNDIALGINLSTHQTYRILDTLEQEGIIRITSKKWHLTKNTIL